MTQLKLKQHILASQSSFQLQDTGILTEWNDERGYGFITPANGGAKIFLHVKSLKREARRPTVGELFFFKLKTDERGRLRAEDAFQTILDEKRDLSFWHNFMRGLARRWPLGLFVPAIIAIWQVSFEWGVITAFIINSLLTARFYREDKFLAKYKYWRIPENHLHIWELLCGWPGALYAMLMYRHKSRKDSFKLWFGLCVIINCGAICYVISQVGLQNTNQTIQKIHNVAKEIVQTTIQ